MFLLLSAITAVLECGSIFLGIHLDYGPGGILSFCLAYQIGNLFPIPFRLGRKSLTCIVWLIPILLCLAPFCKEFPLLQWGLYFTGLALLSCIVQNIRAVMKGSVSTVLKRISRVIGFLLAPLMAYIPLPLLSACYVVIWIAWKHTKKTPTNTSLFFYKGLWKDSGYHIMLWHQMHYFVYAYGMILWIYQITNRPFVTMTFFAGTWVTYLATEPLLIYLYKARSKSGPRPVATILGGHIFLLFILLLMPHTSSFLLILLWILTGFGGGTVFSITALCKSSPSYKKEYLEFIENIGHFAGTALALFWVLLVPHKISSLCYISVLCVFMVLTLTLKRRRILQEKETKL